MTKLNIEFMDEKERFFSKIEDDLEEKVLKYYSKPDQKVEETDEELFFYISEWRNALLEWYPLKRNDYVLEIGAGFGTISEMLAKKVNRLVCVEKKAKRCEILHKRLDKYDNVEILNLNIKELDTDKRFDYVIIHDIVGYLKKYYKSERALLLFLKQIKTLLNKSGRILLAVENRLGLKYFAGATEDYSGKFFVGLNNYDGYDVIKTYSYEELLYWIKLAGFQQYKFYYPFPDNDFPVEIYTDKILKSIYYGGPISNVGDARLVLFDEQEMFRTLQDEGVISRFVNAYLVELSLDNCFSDVVYYRIDGNGEKDKKAVIYYEKEDDLWVDCNRSGILQKIPEGERFDQLLVGELDKILKARTDNLQEIISGIENIWFNLYTSMKDMIKTSLSKHEEKSIRLRQIDFAIEDIYYNGKFQLIAYSVSKETYSLDLRMWKLLYEWYNKYVYQYSKLRKNVDLGKVFDKLQWDDKKIKMLKEQSKAMERKVDSLSSHYGNLYYSNFLHPIDAARNGDMIVSNIDARKAEQHSKQELISKEQQIIDIMRS